MVIKINKKIEVAKIEKTLKLPEDLRNQIEDFWKKQIAENQHLFNGEVRNMMWNVTIILILVYLHC